MAETTDLEIFIHYTKDYDTGSFPSALAASYVLKYNTSIGHEPMMPH